MENRNIETWLFKKGMNISLIERCVQIWRKRVFATGSTAALVDYVTRFVL